MGFDPAIVLFGAVVLFLVAILVGVIVVALSPWEPPDAEESITQDADVSGRLAAISQQIATLNAEIDHLDEEVELLREERDQLRTVLTRVAELLEQFPRIGGG